MSFTSAEAFDKTHPELFEKSECNHPCLDRLSPFFLSLTLPLDKRRSIMDNLRRNGTQHSEFSLKAEIVTTI